MKSISDQEFAQTEMLLRERLAQLADHAPATVQLADEVRVVATNHGARRGRRVGVLAAVTALIGAGGFTTYSFLAASNDGGAATPEEATSAFVSAIEHEDLLGVIDVTLPEEVGELRSAVDSISGDAKRVDLLADSFDASGIQGVDVSVDDLALSTEFLEGGLAKVTATSGTVNATFDPQTFPFGDKVRAVLGDNLDVGTASSTFGNDDPIALLMTVERGGRWYVSLEYTVAEYVRQAAGWEVDSAVSRTPVGFDSPDQAVSGFYDRVATFDLQGAMDTFAPGEDAMAWLAQGWLTDAQSVIDRSRLDGWSVGISGLTYDTTGEGDHLTLRPKTFKIEGTVPAGFGADTSGTADPSLPTVVTAFEGSGYTLVPPGQVPATIEGLHFTDTFPTLEGNGYNFTEADTDGNITQLVFPTVPTGGPQPFTIERADDCTTFTGSASSIFGLNSGSVPNVKPVDGGYQVCGTNGFLGAVGLLLSSGDTELPSISVVQAGGKWYVSPLGTILASATTTLHDAGAASSLFDSPLAPFFYAGFNRSFLESFVVGHSADSVTAECLPALTVVDGQITGVAANPSPDAVKACSDLSGDFSSSSSGSSSSGPDESVVVASTVAPEQAPDTPAPAESTPATTEPAATTP
jgi:hypothetical protein